MLNEEQCLWWWIASVEDLDTLGMPIGEIPWIGEALECRRRFRRMRLFQHLVGNYGYYSQADDRGTGRVLRLNPAAVWRARLGSAIKKSQTLARRASRRRGGGGDAGC